MSTSPREAATTYLDAWKAGDFDTLRDLFADDVTFHGVLDFHTTTGVSMPTVNWSHLNGDGKIDAIRVTFDPRPLLDSHRS